MGNRPHILHFTIMGLAKLLYLEKCCLGALLAKSAPDSGTCGEGRKNGEIYCLATGLTGETRHLGDGAIASHLDRQALKPRKRNRKNSP